MKRVIILIMAIISILLLVTDLAAEKNFMWEVENEGTKIYLLGSIHLMPDSIYPLADEIEAAFQESDVLMVEADPAKLDQNKVQQMIQQNGIYADGKTLKTELDPELYKRLTLTLNEFGLAIQQFDTLKPWFVSLNLAVLSVQKLGIRAENGIDVHFIDQAKTREMEIVELEDALFQLKMLMSFPEESQEDYLIYSLDNLNKVDDIFADMLGSWQDGDTERMNLSTKLKMQEFAEDMPGMKEFYDNMFTKRDLKIFIKLEDLLQGGSKKTYFVVVGSGHLIGDNGLLELLENKGYKPKQL